MYESLGMQCEMHVGGFGNLAILGSTTEEQCEYYERGLTKPDEDRDACPVFLKNPSDPMDDNGYVYVYKYDSTQTNIWEKYQILTDTSTPGVRWYF